MSRAELSYPELLRAANMTPAEKSHAERVRIDEIQRRWTRRNGDSQIKRDVQFLIGAVVHNYEINRQLMAMVQQAKASNVELTTRVKQQVEANEKRLVVATPADLRGLPRPR